MASTLLRVGSSVPQLVTTVTLDPSAIGANTVSSETFTVTGANTDMNFSVSAPNLDAGLFILEATCATANILTISIWNTTVASVNPASQVFRVIGF